MELYQKVVSLGLLAIGLSGTSSCGKSVEVDTYVTGTVTSESIRREANYLGQLVYRCVLETKNGTVVLKEVGSDYTYGIDSLIDRGDEVTVRTTNKKTGRIIDIGMDDIIKVKKPK